MCHGEKRPNTLICYITMRSSLLPKKIASKALIMLITFLIFENSFQGRNKGKLKN